MKRHHYVSPTRSPKKSLVKEIKDNSSDISEINSDTTKEDKTKVNSLLYDEQGVYWGFSPKGEIITDTKTTKSKTTNSPADYESSCKTTTQEKKTKEVNSLLYDEQGVYHGFSCKTDYKERENQIIETLDVKLIGDINNI